MRSPFVKTLAIQCLALLVAGLIIGIAGIHGSAIYFFALASVFAVGLALLSGVRDWWLIFHGLLPLALFAAGGLNLSSSWYLIGLLFLLGLFFPVVRQGAPFFLSSPKATQELAQLLAGQASAGPLRVLDCGCATAGLLVGLARALPNAELVGAETAPISFWIARLRASGVANLTVLYRDFWAIDFSSYSVIYAFLAPPPMSALWEKFSREARPGALLISNSFAIANVKPEQIIEVDDRRRTRLYVYRCNAK